MGANAHAHASANASAHACASLADALGMLADGRCVVKVSDTFGMDDAYAGFKTLAERRAVGKVVVAPGLVGRSRL